MRVRDRLVLAAKARLGVNLEFPTGLGDLKSFDKLVWAFDGVRLAGAKSRGNVFDALGSESQVSAAHRVRDELIYESFYVKLA